MSIDNIEVTGVVELWSAASLPWQDDPLWTNYPKYNKINNIEQT